MRTFVVTYSVCVCMCMVIHIAYMIYFLFKAINQYCFTKTLKLRVSYIKSTYMCLGLYSIYYAYCAYHIMMIIQLRAITETNAFRVNY